MKIWEFDSSTPLGKASMVFGLAYTPDSRLVSLETQQTGLVIQVSDAKGRPIETRPLTVPPGPFSGMTLREDGLQFALANAEGRVIVGGLDSPTKDLGIIAPAGEGTQLKLSRDGRMIAASGANSMVKVYDIDNRRPIREWSQPCWGGIGLAFSPDGRRVATTSFGSPISAFDLATGKPIFAFGGIQEKVVRRSVDGRVTYSPDGRFLLGDSAGATPSHLLDGSSGSFLREIAGNVGSLIGLTFSPDGSRLVGAMQDHSVRLWDTATGQETLTLQGHANSVVAVAFRADGRAIASAEMNGTVRVWDGSDPGP